MEEQTKNEIMKSLGGLEEGIKLIHEQMKIMNGSREKHDNRIKSLENDRAKVMGLAGGIGIASGVVVAWFKDKFWSN